MRNLLGFTILAAVAGLANAQAPNVGNCSVFPADNIWNTRVDQLQVHPSSSTWVNTIGASSHMHPDFGSGTYDGGPIGIPYVTVPGTQTKYPATFTYQSESDTGPYAIPLTAPIEGGSASGGDRHVIAVDTDHCILYEIYAAYPQASSWTGGSGAIYSLSSDALRPSTWTSADAAGLPIFPGLVRYDEIVAGEIRHAIRFTVPQSQAAFVWPARHEASSHTANTYPPMGARFRLKAGFDISGYSATNKIILTALKRYGMMIPDNGSSWYISGAPDARWNNDDLHVLNNIAGSNFEAVDVSTLMVNPNSGQARQTSVSVSVSPSSASVAVNAQQHFSATVNGSSDQSVTWDVNGSVGGNGAVGFIDSISGLYTAPSIAPSPAIVTVHAVSHALSSAVGSASVTIAGAAPVADFSLGISAGPGSVAAGGSAAYTVTVTSKNGFHGVVSFAVSGLPSGVTGSFSPSAVTGSGSSTLTVKTSAGTAAGSFTVSVTGTSGSLHHTSSASLSVTGSGGGSSGPPATVSVTPSSGSGTSRTFSFRFTDPHGAADISSAQMDINTQRVMTGACASYFVRATSSIYLANDAGSWQGPLTLGQTGSLQNSQCTLNAGASSASASGNTLTLNLALTFKPAFTGAKNVYMEVRNATEDSGWAQRGTWTPGTVVAAAVPVPVSSTPNTGGGLAHTFTFAFSDGNGAADIVSAQMNINATTVVSKACAFYYVRSSKAIYLANDAGVRQGPLTIGSAGTLQNSQCSLNTGSSSAAMSGNNLTLNLALTFKVAFLGTKKIYMEVQNAAHDSGWVQKGTWMVP